MLLKNNNFGNPIYKKYNSFGELISFSNTKTIVTEHETKEAIGSELISLNVYKYENMYICTLKHYPFETIGKECIYKGEFISNGSGEGAHDAIIDAVNNFGFDVDTYSIPFDIVYELTEILFETRDFITTETES